MFQRLLHTAGDLRAGNTQVFRAKGHILFHHVGDDLIIRILENHTHITADADQKFLIGGIQAADIDLAAAGKQNGIKMLGKGGFSATIAAQNRHKTTLFNCKIQIRKDGDTGRVVHARICII